MTPVAAIKWSWLLGAVALAAFLWLRRSKLGRLTLGAGVVALVVMVAFGAGLVHLPNIEKLIEKVGETLGPWTYLLVGVMAFLETGAFVGLIAPGETTVMVGGLVAGQGQISLLVLIGITWACALAGDLVSYEVGRRLGRDFLIRHGERVKITEERIVQVEGFFERRGGVTILVGRFIGFVRAVAPFIAGASHMPLRKFLPYDVLGSGAWATTYCVLGYAFWQSFSQLTTYVSRGLLAFSTVVAVIVGIVVLVQLRRDAEKRAKVRAWLAAREDRPAWRPIVRAAGPLWRRLGRPAAAGADRAARFSWNRLTPGDLGLELTTLLALLAVGGFTFVVLGQTFGGGIPRIDRWAFDVTGRLATAAPEDLAKLLTWLGSLPVVTAAVLATAAWAAWRGRRLDALALPVGLALSYAAAHLAKAAYDRPRPAGGLVDTALSAYPSGHALYVVSLIACATVLVRTGAGWAIRFAAVTVAVALVAVVAASRVYLRAHYLTDVLGGVALGVAVWSLVGVAALVAVRVRHNGTRTP